MKLTISSAVLSMLIAITVLSQSSSSGQGGRTSGDTSADLHVLQVNADRSRMESSGGERLIVYEGQAEAWMGQSRLRADRITVYGGSEKAVAEGHATFQQGGERMSGSSIEWSYSEGRNRVTIVF
jgi:hypothetical protein